jgi:putative FmdB family regulatory protein
VPTYQYVCTECGGQIEAVQRFTDDPLTVHDACGGKLRKVFSPVGIVFKGSGFYRTDSRGGSGTPSPAPSPAAATSGESGSSSGSVSESSSPAASSSGGADKPASTAGSSGSSGSSGKSSEKVA